ncbi:unnamed protein product [Brassica oleracea]
MQARNGAHSSEGKGKIHSNPVGYGRTSEAVHGDGTLRRARKHIPRLQTSPLFKKIKCCCSRSMI